MTPAERAMLEQALACSAVGSPETVKRGVEDFVARTGADELIVTSQIYEHACAPALVRDPGAVVGKQPELEDARAKYHGVVRRTFRSALHLMNVPSRRSDIACCSSAFVFITIGPYQATGSSIGLPEISRKRMP